MSVGRVLLVQSALDGTLTGLLLAPRVDLADDVHAHVGSAGDALLLAQPSVVRPRLIVDADHSAGLPFRRHADSVADRPMCSHPPVTKWLPSDLLLTGHPDVRFKGAKAAPKRTNKPP